MTSRVRAGPTFFGLVLVLVFGCGSSGSSGSAGAGETISDDTVAPSAGAESTDSGTTSVEATETGSLGGSSADSTSSAGTDSEGTGCEPLATTPLLLRAGGGFRGQAFDYDRDGSVDVFTEDGVVLQGPEFSRSWVAVARPPVGRGWIGNFLATRAASAAYVSSDGPAVVYTQLGEQATVAGTTQLPPNLQVRVADFNGDGLDDLALIASNFIDAEVWTSDGQGQFMLAAVDGEAAELPVIGTMADPGADRDLLLLARGDLRGMKLREPRSTLEEEFAFEEVGLYFAQGLALGIGEERATLFAKFHRQLVTSNAIGYIFQRRGEWDGAGFELSDTDAVRINPVAMDIDDNGLPDILFVLEGEAGDRLVGVCFDGRELSPCVDRPIDSQTEALVALPGKEGARLVSTSPESTWLVEFGCNSGA